MRIFGAEPIVERHGALLVGSCVYIVGWKYA
jgi:hypothetical protein